MSSIEDLINQLKIIINDQSDIDHLSSVLNKYISCDWFEHIKFNDSSYNKIYLFRSAQFDLILICWKKGQCTKVHDHPRQGCLMKILKGQLTENIFVKNDHEIIFQSSKSLMVNDLAFQSKDIVLHQIIADMDSISLHIYAPGHYIPKYY